VVLAGAKVISGETLLCANLGLGLRLVSEAESVRHTLLFDTGPEGTIFMRNCANLGLRLGEVECIAVSHGHWDHMAALPQAVEAIVKGGGQVAVHVNPGMFNERAVRLKSGKVVPVANVPSPTELEKLGARMVNRPATLDTIVATNLHADILSDLAAALAGSLGIAPTGNIDPEHRYPSMFEPIHGSAFDIMGKGLANPVGTFWSVVMMLEHLGETAAAKQVMNSIEQVTANPALHTGDLGGKATTAQVTQAVCELLAAAAQRKAA